VRDVVRDLFEAAMRTHRERTFAEFAGETLSYDDLERWSRAVALQLRSLGVGVGDPVAIYTRNRFEFAVTDVAVARIGAVKVPINFMLAADTVGYILQATKARVVVVDDQLAGALTGVLHGDGAPSPVVVALPGAGIPDAHRYAPRPGTGEEPGDLAPVAISPEDVAAIYFTGGTTGKPKGVVHTQASTVALHHAQMLEGEVLQDERMLIQTPMAHAAGLFTQTCLIRGATAVLRDGFDVTDTVRAIRDEGITWAFLVPTMIYRVLDELEANQPSDGQLRIRTIVYGAAPMTPARLERALELFGPVFIQLYAQTESPNWGTRLAKTDHDLDRPERLASCGRPSIFADVKVVDEAGMEVPCGQVGEIALRTEYVLREYLDNPEATREKFLGDFILTGDVGLVDEGGYLFLKDRKNDMVISGGMNVYCTEVEAVLSRHPSVNAVAVIGVPHEDWGETVLAVVVPGDGFDEAEVLAWTRGKLAAYARPKAIATLPALPETAFGKVDKKALRAPYWSARERAIG
jgi:fatty-acyl-CoA synthase/long-chain acyl-CoA synthetase